MTSFFILLELYLQVTPCLSACLHAIPLACLLVLIVNDSSPPSPLLKRFVRQLWPSATSQCIYGQHSWSLVLMCLRPPLRREWAPSNAAIALLLSTHLVSEWVIEMIMKCSWFFRANVSSRNLNTLLTFFLNTSWLDGIHHEFYFILIYPIHFHMSVSICVCALCCVCYLGTTGPPKAVMISHDNVTWTARVSE